MQTVHAYRDNGPMSTVSRWKPRRVFCSERQNQSEFPAVEHVVKFRQGKAGTGALISEVVCGQLLRAGDVLVLDARLVYASEGFAASCKTKEEIPYIIDAGLHFGTIWRPDLQAGPPLRIEELANPQELVDLWVFDCWFCTTDRSVYGNILLEHIGGGKYHLVAADQSDGFGGAGRLADGSWKKCLQEPKAAETLNFLDRAIYDGGGSSALKIAVAKVEQSAKMLQEVVDQVPQAWWSEVDIGPREIKDALEQRLDKLDTILDLKKWEGLDHATQGGRLL